ncbi:MAG: DUF4398 domain-containing protein [Desulfuromonadales bacterium]
MYKFLVLLFLFVLGGCASLPQHELRVARESVAQAYAVGAPQLAPLEYRSASTALYDAEKYIHAGDYRQARQILPLAQAHARRAISRSLDEAARLRELEAAQAAERASLSIKTPVKKKPTRPAAPKVPDSSTAESPADKDLSPATPVLAPQYTVVGGENLWSIAAKEEVYADGLLWPLLYKANRDQIKDPRQIYPGQVLSIPRDLSAEAMDEAREKARRSDIFPVDIMLKPRELVE